MLDGREVRLYVRIPSLLDFRCFSIPNMRTSLWVNVHITWEKHIDTVVACWCKVGYNVLAPHGDTVKPACVGPPPY